MIAHLIGTGSANAGPDRTTTMLVIEHDGQTVLVDCGGDAAQRMQACGLDPVALDAIILTHEHPDHIGGYALLLEKLWLMGRRDPISVYGLGPTLEKARALFRVFDTAHWDGMPERRFTEVAFEPKASVLDLRDLRVTATPVDHPVPTIGLRFETADSVLAYSCDTAVCDSVVELAKGAQVLIHEGTGSLPGVHSSPEEAARVAASAGVDRLVLVHAPAGASDDGLGDARQTFENVSWGHDGDQVSL